jgi:hypothetical protein
MATHFEKEVWDIHSTENMTDQVFHSKFAAKRRVKNGKSALQTMPRNGEVGGL